MKVTTNFSDSKMPSLPAPFYKSMKGLAHLALCLIQSTLFAIKESCHGKSLPSHWEKADGWQ